MFILRGLTFILSILGYLLAVTVGYFGFYPIDYPTQPELNLKSLISCNTTSSHFGMGDLTQDKISDLKSKTGPNAPIELIRDFMNSIDSVTQNIGSSPELNVQYCDVQQLSKEVLTKINTELTSKKPYYEFGEFNDFVKSVNDLPFAKLSNIEVKIDSTFARTNYCNSPITKGKLYLFTVVDSNVQNVRKAMMFQINIVESKSSQQWQKFVRNITTSGQYLKAQIKCNGQ